MQYLFEYCDKLKSPYEAFFYDSSCMPFPVSLALFYGNDSDGRGNRADRLQRTDLCG